MYTILKSGGKQYRIEEGRYLDVERLNCVEGEKVSLQGWVLQPEGTLAQAEVLAVSLGELKTDKVLIFKKNRRHNYRRKRGHRQTLTRIRVEKIAI